MFKKDTAKAAAGCGMIDEGTHTNIQEREVENNYSGLWQSFIKGCCTSRVEMSGLSCVSSGTGGSFIPLKRAMPAITPAWELIS